MQDDCNTTHGGAILAEPLTLEEIAFLKQEAMEREHCKSDSFKKLIHQSELRTYSKLFFFKEKCSFLDAVFKIVIKCNGINQIGIWGSIYKDDLKPKFGCI